MGSPNISTRSNEQVKELQASLSKLALENEELRFELAQMRQQYQDLSEENQQLYQTVQEKTEIQDKMGRQLDTVTRTAYTLYEKFKAFKCRYYEEQCGREIDRRSQ